MAKVINLLLFGVFGLLIVGLSGCTTTRSAERDEIDRLRARVLQLESEIEVRDKRQREAEDELERAFEARQAAEDKLDAQQREFAEAEKEKAALQRLKEEELPEPRKDAMSQVAVRQIQTALYNAGYDPGPIDGKMGKKTKLAIKEFQKDNGLKPDGIVGNQTWSKLGKYLTMKRYEK